MRVDKIERILIEFNRDEIYSIACDVWRRIESTAKDHWVNHYEGSTDDGFLEYVIKNEPNTKFIKMVDELTQYNYMWSNFSYTVKRIWSDHKKGQSA